LKTELPVFLTLRSGGSPLVPYAVAWKFQKSLVERRIRDEIPDTFLFVEHPPTVTRGRGLQRKPGDDSDLRAMPIGALPPGTEYFEIERGGDLTWHGPGQLVVYPVVKLDGSGFGPNHDVTGYLRKLEGVFAAWLGKHGLSTDSRAGAAGIWVEDKPSGLEGPARKIASIGIAVRKWVTYHGIGVNLTNSLVGFHSISPCGFAPEVMTTLANERPAEFGSLAPAALRGRVEAEIAEAIAPGSVVRTEEV
jgi:lipoyl(octanoyl) transferase